MVRTLRFHCHGLGSIPGRGTKILQAMRHEHTHTHTHTHTREREKENRISPHMTEHHGVTSAGRLSTFNMLARKQIQTNLVPTLCSWMAGQGPRVVNENGPAP